MATTFYIHIGVHKTGTKTIQQTLSNNRRTLLKHGINSLPGDPNHGPVLISLLSDSPHEDARNIRRHVDTPEKAASYNASTKHKIAKALARNRSPKMVISGEGLSDRPPREIDRLRQMLNPYAAAYRVIVYVRDPYEYANSASLQRIKSGSILGDTKKKLPLPNYRRRIERYIRAFGRENVDIRIFDPRRFVGGSLVSDFLVALGESPELEKQLHVVRANQSISHEAAMILSETNSAIPSHVGERANRARAFGFHTYVADIEGEKFAIDPHAYSNYEPKVTVDLEWLHQTIAEPVFGRPSPRSASVPRWSEATVLSIKQALRKMVLRLEELERDRRLPRIPRPALPAGLEWLGETYRPAAGQTRMQSAAVPQFDQASVRALGCFLHAVALTIQHLEAERSARKGRWLILASPRLAEDHFRDVVRLNPGSAAGQYRLSQAHLVRGHIVEAREAAEAAVQLAPQRAWFKRWLRLVDAAGRRLLKPPAPVPIAACKQSRDAGQPAGKDRPGRQAAR